MIHVRIDHRDHGRHGQHGFERVAAFGKDVATGCGGGEVRGAGDAATVTGAMQIHNG